MANNRESRECEICDEMAICSLHNNIWMCNECWLKEQRAKIEAWEFAQSQANAPVIPPASHISPLPINSILREAASIDSTIQVRTDIYNAKTAAIKDIKDTIDADSNIENKPYALAEFLKNRFIHLKSVIFEHNQVIVDAGNEQKAIQVYLNTLANSLRAEEREKLKIADINYQPGKVKTVRTVKSSIAPVNKGKAFKAAVKKLAVDLGISEFTVSMVATQKGSVEKAAEYFKSIKEG